MKKYDLGFDIGGTNIAAGIYDVAHELLSDISVPFPAGEGIDAISLLLCDIKNELAAKSGICEADINSVGIAVPGSIDRCGAIVIDAYNLGLHNAPLLESARSCMPDQDIMLINDANAATLAELYKGALLGCRTAALLTLGTGVGGGLIMNGRIFNGGRGSGAEPGHMILVNGGEACTCGVNGCVEAMCSATWLINEGRRSFCGMIRDMANGDAANVTAKLLIDCAKRGDGTALGIFDRYIDALGSAVASIINILDPETVAIGGGVSLAGDFLFEPLRVDVDKKSFFHTHGSIVPAMLGNQAGMLGAALLKEHLSEFASD